MTHVAGDQKDFGLNTLICNHTDLDYNWGHQVHLRLRPFPIECNSSATGIYFFRFGLKRNSGIEPFKIDMHFFNRHGTGLNGPNEATRRTERRVAPSTDVHRSIPRRGRGRCGLRRAGSVARLSG